MNAIIKALLINIRCLTLVVWLIITIFCFFQGWIFYSIKDWVIGGGIATKLSIMSILFEFWIGASFFSSMPNNLGPIESANYDGRISFRFIYFSRTALLFIIIVMAPLVGVCVAATNPVMRIEFYDRIDAKTTADKMEFYQRQFPDGTLINKEEHKSIGKDYKYIFSIPSGILLVALWDLVIALLVAISFQLMALFVKKSKKMRLENIFILSLMIYFAVSFMIVTVWPQKLSGLTLYESLFFGFNRHQSVVWVAVCLLIALVQVFAAWRFDHLKVGASHSS